MPVSKHDSCHRKVEQVLRRALGTKYEVKWGKRFGNIRHAIYKAVRRDHKRQVAHDIAFHLSDWCDDAAFLVALTHRPDLFTPAEIRAGVMQCLIHVPHHIIAAATLDQWELKDIFNVGANILPVDPPPSKTMARNTRSIRPLSSSQFIERVEGVLRGGLAKSNIGLCRFSAERIPGTKMHRIIIVSDFFDKIPPSERRDLIWRIMDHSFSFDDQLRISMIMALGTSEAVGV